MDSELLAHKEKFAAAFLKEVGLNPEQVVMMVKGDILNQEIWFRKKTERELEIDMRSETTIRELRFCPVCPCENCIVRRGDAK